MGKYQSKRQTLQMKYKIQRRVKEHKRKLKKAAKKLAASGGGQWKSKVKELPIPNDWPFKEQMLAEIERQKQIDKEVQERNRLERKKALEKKKAALAAGNATDPKAAQSVLPSGVSGAAPLRPSAQNAIMLDAYTRRVWREIKQAVDEADVVLEVLDARDPLGSRTLEIEQWMSGKLADKSAKRGAEASKPLILVLNKCDLVPVEVTQAWLQFFEKHDSVPTIAFHTHRPLDSSDMRGSVVSPKELCSGAESLSQLIANFQASADQAAQEQESGERKAFKVAVIGYANVGKSSVLNTLARTHLAGVGAVGGYTKQLQRHRLSKGLFAIDTPAVPVKEDAPGPHTTLPLIDGRMIGAAESFVRHFDADNLISVLQIPAVESFEELLDQLATKAGRQMKGGKLNHVVAARKLFKDWNDGKLPFFTPPPDMDDEEEEEQEGNKPSNPIDAFFAASNRRTLAGLRQRKGQLPLEAFLQVQGSIFDEGEEEDSDDEEEMEDGEDEEGEDEEMEMDGEDDEEEEQEDGEDEEEEDEEEEEEEEEVAPPPPSNKRKAAASAAPAAKKAKQAASPAKPAAPAVKAAPTPKGSKAAAAAAAPAPASRKRRAPEPEPEPESEDEEEEESEEEEEEEPVPAPKKKRAAASKQNASKPSPKPAEKKQKQKAAPAPAPAPTPKKAAAASASKKGKGKK